ncbi:HNH nuclease [uncultured Caudovirales phage]|uniref:HNH nuclease n=1 Tax=uncultured Caudovirales phage TaxID=2100421 RepID=A0A6J5T959_9CAUD|nr:HNH nuclease [uncultured Caudovirales phage]
MTTKIVSVAFDKATGEIVKTMSNGAERRSIGSAHSAGYRVTRFDAEVVHIHRLAFFLVEGEWPECQVDHINGNRADNRWVNLRKVSAEINMQNIRKATAASASGFLGASPHGGKWCAFLKVDGKSKYLGIFSTPEEAHKTYLEAKRIHHQGCTI